MQGNDLESGVVAHNVVLLVPTLAVMTRNRKVRRPRPDDFEPNLGMISWMLNHSYQHSETFEVWSFEHEELFNVLTAAVENYASRATNGYVRFESENEARFALVNDRGIKTVYDADHSRIDRLWGLRGYRVPFGGTP